LVGIPFGRLLIRGKHQGIGPSGRPFTHFLKLIGRKEKTKVWFSPLVDRIAGQGAGAWSIQMEAARLCDQGQDVIFLTVGDFRPCRAKSRS